MSEQTAAFHGLATNPTIPPAERLELALQALDLYEQELAAAEARGYDRAVANLRETIAVHWLAEIVCDHERGMDNPRCACSLVDLGWHRSVGVAVAAWIEHLLEATKETTL